MTDSQRPARSSPKYLAAREALPAELRCVFDQLVDEYEFRTQVRFGRGYVAYQVLADLVLMGWRPSGPVLDAGDSQETKEKS